ncbi:MAG: hypothetical protein MUP11_00565, partial [Anaerolineales bacterium]|nr:hypothetical protein [Anaerolineales bacterium]
VVRGVICQVWFRVEQHAEPKRQAGYYFIRLLIKIIVWPLDHVGYGETINHVIVRHNWTL